MDCKDILKMTATGLTGMAAGAAFYVNGADHPARMTLDTVNCRKHWAAAFSRAKKFQSLMVLGGSSAAAAVYYLDKDSNSRLLWLVGSGVLIAAWPWTLFVMLPDINRNLKEDAMKTEGESWVREHICRWNKQHAVRTVLAMAAFDIFMYAMLKH